ncbi:hypothetical protein [Bifidobacterium tibiigranuli]|jgi:hypothetical protein|uniref:hypothetical protein n=1 Tax=Bifidobacterium tibiigranuli TaxID=2172043 RepID=UPI0026EF3362|nr:hypothetical protein [Bifidobacterium tibiigranuli]MCI1712656.1 hypothetical protein [Bifidobacterium tibiigranuli]
MNTTNGDKDNEQLAVTAIERGIDGLEPGTVVSKQVAQLIAAALHRDADSELKHFAETGTVINHQAARLELFYTVKGETGFARWADTLRDYISADERTQVTSGKGDRQ